MNLSMLLSRGSFKFQPLAVPSLGPIAASAKRILQRWPDVIPEPPERDRERIVQEMKRCISTNDWQGVRLSFVTTAARVAFDLERRARDDLEEVRTFYYDEIRASDRQSFLGAMFSIYMGSYQPGAPHTVRLAKALADAKPRFGAKWLSLLEHIPDILDPDAAHKAICTLMLDMDAPWDGLRAMGIRSPHAPGIMDHAHTAFVAALRPRLTQRKEMERLIGWLKPTDAGAKVVYAGFAISELLEPWAKKSPSEDDQAYLTESIVGLYGDPRVQKGGVWLEVSDVATAVLLRWLTRAYIHFFLDVVSRVESSHLWEPRRKFWSYLYEEGWIDEAWVALSPLGAEVASRIRRSSQSDGHSTLNYGLQTARGSRLHTSLLILKIDRKIVVEGSHNYKVHIFDESDRAAPQLFQDAYDCEEIRLSGNPKTRAHQSGWQNWVMEHI